jgi:hypothetical protein
VFTFLPADDCPKTHSHSRLMTNFKVKVILQPTDSLSGKLLLALTSTVTGGPCCIASARTAQKNTASSSSFTVTCISVLEGARLTGRYPAMVVSSYSAVLLLGVMSQYYFRFTWESWKMLKSALLCLFMVHLKTLSVAHIM